LEGVKKADRIEIPTVGQERSVQKTVRHLYSRVGKFGNLFLVRIFQPVILKSNFVEETPFLCPKDGGK